MTLRRALVAFAIALGACTPSGNPTSSAPVGSTEHTSAAVATESATAPTSTVTAPPPPTHTAAATPSASSAPTSPPSGKCAGSPPQPGFVCAQGCGGPIARPNDPPPPFVWADPKRVRDGHVWPCPICLPEDARIATPSGDVRARDMKVGAIVWTRSDRGERVAAPVVEVGSIEAPPAHRIARVALDDGRVASASPMHPTADGRALGAVKVGDLLDGARVVSVTLVPYAGERTFDLLPAGARGVYWADGVELGSTLAGSRRP